ncbi:hypothetical protein PFISCL1PPCAC_11688, partial [Pristionchus fissidentatus]
LVVLFAVLASLVLSQGEIAPDFINFEPHNLPYFYPTEEEFIVSRQRLRCTEEFNCEKECPKLTGLSREIVFSMMKVMCVKCCPRPL